MSDLTPQSEAPTPTTDKITQAARETIYLCNFRVSVDGEWLCLRELNDISLTPEPEPAHEGRRSGHHAAQVSLLGNVVLEFSLQQTIHCVLNLIMVMFLKLSIVTILRGNPEGSAMLAFVLLMCPIISIELYAALISLCRTLAVHAELQNVFQVNKRAVFFSQNPGLINSNIRDKLILWD